MFLRRNLKSFFSLFVIQPQCLQKDFPDHTFFLMISDKRFSWPILSADRFGGILAGLNLLLLF